TLFPYTTLFRSPTGQRGASDDRVAAARRFLGAVLDAPADGAAGGAAARHGAGRGALGAEAARDSVGAAADVLDAGADVEQVDQCRAQGEEAEEAEAAETAEEQRQTEADGQEAEPGALGERADGVDHVGFLAGAVHHRYEREQRGAEPDGRPDPVADLEGERDGFELWHGFSLPLGG